MTFPLPVNWHTGQSPVLLIPPHLIHTIHVRKLLFSQSQATSLYICNTEVEGAGEWFNHCLTPQYLRVNGLFPDKPSGVSPTANPLGLQKKLSRGLYSQALGLHDSTFPIKGDQGAQPLHGQPSESQKSHEGVIVSVLAVLGSKLRVGVREEFSVQKQAMPFICPPLWGNASIQRLNKFR